MRYDHEAQSSYALTVTADDGNDGTASVDVTVEVTDVDEPPLAPAAPTVGPAPGSMTGLTVVWTAPSNTGRPEISSYDVRYRRGTSGDWTDGPQGHAGDERDDCRSWRERALRGAGARGQCRGRG